MVPVSPEMVTLSRATAPSHLTSATTRFPATQFDPAVRVAIAVLVEVKVRALRR
jgi:hypothetical protein